MDAPILSIYVPIFNHEKYIVQALDSILMQETDYPFEVLVGEDCSTDNTRVVLQNYEAQHPGKFTIFYRDHNMYRENPSNTLDLKLRCRGKYMIALEGDDYWTDPYKLDKQIRFLENQPEYIAVAHNCVIVDHHSNPKNESYPECKNADYTFRHYFSEIMPGQLATVMYRNMFIDDRYDTSVLQRQIVPGDRIIYFWLLTHGKVHCLQETMSAYRHVTDHGSSFSATHQYRFSGSDTLCKALIQCAQDAKNPEALQIAQDLHFRNLMQGIKRRQCTREDVQNTLEQQKNLPLTLWRYIGYKIRKDLLHNQFWM